MTSRPDPIDLSLCDRYFAGECTPDEIAAMEQWIARTAANAQLFAALRAEFEVSNADPPRSDPEVVWSRIAARLPKTETKLDAIPGTSTTRSTSGVVPLRVIARSEHRGPRRAARFLGAAAAIALLVGGALIARQRSRSVPPSTPAAGREYVAQRGQRAEVQLLDGTRVTLAPGSRLSVPAGYEASRVLTLAGEALFDVAHRRMSPFVVRAGHAIVRDIGTKFDVRAFDDDNSVRIVVTQGAVQLVRSAAAADTGPVLLAGDVGRVAAEGTMSVRHNVNVTPLVAWSTGTLVFDRTPLRTALAELARWCDVDFQVVGNARDDRTLTANLQSPSLDDVLHLVSVSLEMRVERRGRTITLYADH